MQRLLKPFLRCFCCTDTCGAQGLLQDGRLFGSPYAPRRHFPCRNEQRALTTGRLLGVPDRLPVSNAPPTFDVDTPALAALQITLSTTGLAHCTAPCCGGIPVKGRNHAGTWCTKAAPNSCQFARSLQATSRPLANTARRLGRQYVWTGRYPASLEARRTFSSTDGNRGNAR